MLIGKLDDRAWDILGRVFVSRHRARLKSPAILASKDRMRRRKAKRLNAEIEGAMRRGVSETMREAQLEADRPRDLAWNRMAIPEIDERVGRGGLGVLTVPTYLALAQWPQMVPIGTR